MRISHFWLLPGLIPFASLLHAGLTLKKNIYMNMNYSSLSTMYDKNCCPNVHISGVNIFFVQFWLKIVHGKMQKL